MHRIRGLDLQRREASARRVIQQMQDLPGTRRCCHPVRVVFPWRLPRGERYRFVVAGLNRNNRSHEVLANNRAVAIGNPNRKDRLDGKFQGGCPPYSQMRGHDGRGRDFRADHGRAGSDL